MGNSRIYSKIIYAANPENELTDWFGKNKKDKIYLVTEENVNRLWMHKFNDFSENYSVRKIVIPSGENNKKIGSVEKIWEFLSTHDADRKSLLINLGGGMLTDLAGFAASTFKRGIDFLNIPTTLLSQVDASVGGKTGINFNGLKNEIGTFREPAAVIIHTGFLQTIDQNNFLSGFAEMIKHGLIKNSDHLEELKKFNLQEIDYIKLQEIIRHSVEVKEYFVANDPTEKNIRKALNFGHTAGHALESLAMKQGRPVLHGFAVVWGMIVELYLSTKKCGFSQKEWIDLSGWLLKTYGQFNIDVTDFESLFELMTHDKKNEAGRINFTLLSETGQFEINQNCDKKEIFEALEYFRTIQEK